METKLPFSREAEEALLGSVLINPELIYQVDVLPADFYIARHRIIWDALSRMAKAGQAIDFVTLNENLNAAGKLSEIGGPAYLTGLINVVPTSLHAEEYAAVVINKARRRQVLTAANTLAKAAFDEDAEIEDVVGETFTDLVASTRETGDVEHISSFADRLYEQVYERYQNPTDLFGIPTGFAEMDLIFAGMQKQEMVLIAGDPGIGKTMLTTQIAVQMASGEDPYFTKKWNGQPGAIFEMEMTGMALLRRLISARANVKARALRTGHFEEHQWPDITHGFEWAGGLPIYISDATHWTTARIRGKLASLKAKHNIEWCLIDYMMLLQDKVGQNTETERTDYISKALRSIAKDLDIAMLAVHSVEKTNMGDAKKGLRNLRGSGQVSFHADVVMFLNPHIPSFGEEANKNMRTVTFPKFRENDTGRNSFDLRMRSDVPGMEQIPGFVDAEKRLEKEHGNGHKKPVPF